MSLPRLLSLARTPDGLRVKSVVPPEVAAAFQPLAPDGSAPAGIGGTYRFKGTADLRQARSLAIALFGEATPQFRFERGPDGQARLLVHRGEAPGMTAFGHDYTVGLGSGDVFDFELYVDNGLAELAVDGGLVWVTQLHFPIDPAGAVAITATA